MSLSVEYTGDAILGDRQETARFIISTGNGRNPY
jgi:hypothetical protein